MEIVLPLLLSLLLLLPLVRAHSHAKCSSDNGARFRISVSSRQNETGHRLVEVALTRSAESGSSGGAVNQLTVDVEHGSTWCDGTETVSTIAKANAPPARSRHSDYELFHSLGYYKMHSVVQNWEQARRACNKEGAHLIIVNSDAEAGVVRILFANYPKIQGAALNDWAWAGHHDLGIEGQYTTVSGQSVDSTGYNKWFKGEPDNTGPDPGQDCGVIHRGGLLGDSPCAINLGFICEQEL